MKMSEIRMRRVSRKESAITFQAQGYSVKEIARNLSLSTSTIYIYLGENYDDNNFERIMNILFNRGISYLDCLSYKELCCLSRKIKVYGFNKQAKINHLKDALRECVILHLYPQRYYSKEDIKHAYKIRAKETHPDLNKNESKEGVLFQSVYNSYTYLMSRAF